METEEVYFVKVPIVLYNIKAENLMNKTEWFDTYAKINPVFIMYYNPSVYEREGEMIEVTSVYVGAATLTSTLNISEFEKLLNNKKPNK